MSKHFSASVLSFAVIAAVSAGAVNADTLYSSIAGAQTAQFTFYGQGQQVASSTNPSFGDDYYTGYSYINITDLSFFGGLQAAATADHLIIDFYTTSGTRYASIYPKDSEDHGISLHTLNPTDFYQNGQQGIIIPGSGYVVFSPDTYTTLAINPDGSTTTTPGDPNPIPFTLGFGQPPTVGVNDSTLGGTVDNNGLFSKIAYVPGISLQDAQFEIIGIGYGPKSLLGDANDDGTVNLTDLNIVLNHLGTATNLRMNGNFDGAATIDLTDLNDVLNNLGVSLPGNAAQLLPDTNAVAAPEPTSLLPLAPAALLLSRRRRS